MLSALPLALLTLSTLSTTFAAPLSPPTWRQRGADLAPRLSNSSAPLCQPTFNETVNILPSDSDYYTGFSWQPNSPSTEFGNAFTSVDLVPTNWSAPNAWRVAPDSNVNGSYQISSYLTTHFAPQGCLSATNSSDLISGGICSEGAPEIQWTISCETCEADGSGATFCTLVAGADALCATHFSADTNATVVLLPCLDFDGRTYPQSWNISTTSS